MTRLVDLNDIQDIPNSENYLLFSKELFSEHDKIIGQHGIAENEYKIDVVFKDAPYFKAGWNLYILSEPIPSN
jgi:hypothetical protein